MCQWLVLLWTFVALGGGNASAATLTWDGDAGDGLITTADNWTAGIAPTNGDTLVFTGGTSLFPMLSSNLTVGTISFNAAAQSFTLGGTGTYTINSGLTNSSAVTQTILNSVQLGGGQTWSATGGDLLFGGAINNAGFLLTISGAKNTTLAGPISGSGGLTKSGTGALLLSGNNVYTGTTTLSAGQLLIGSNTALGSGTLTLAGGTVQASGGARTLANAVTFANKVTFSGDDDLTFNGSITLGNKGAITVAGPGVLTFNGTVGPSNQNRKLTKQGAGTLVLNGSNTYRGTTLLKAGTLIVGSNTAVGSGTLSLGSATIEAGGAARTLANNVTLAGNVIFGGVNDLTFTGSVNLSASRTVTVTAANTTFRGAVGGGASALTKAGPGILTLSGSNANSFSGGLLVADGTVVLAKSPGVNAFAGALTIGDGSGAAGSAIVQLNAANQIPNAAGITIRADGTLNLSGYTDAVGAVTMSGGSIIGSTGSRLDLGGNVIVTPVGSSASQITASLGLNGSRIIQVDDNGILGDVDLAITGTIINGTAASGITKTGAGTLLLSGASTYSGATTVLAGTVLLDGSSVGAITSGPLGTGALILGDTSGVNSAAVLFGSTGGRTISNPITVRAGSTGTLTLGGLNANGVNGFTGAVTLNASTELSAVAGGEIVFGGVISGVGGITKTGAGLVRLSNVNTFTGTTTVSAGILAYGGNDALGSGVVLINGGTLDLGAGRSDTVGAVTLTTGAITGSGGSTLTSTSGFTLQSGSVSVVLGGPVAASKIGAGTVVLSAPATYTGATNIDAGTLRLGVVQAIPATTALTVASGATLDLNSFDQTSASLAGAGAISLGSGRLTISGTTSTIFSGAITGSGGLTKKGTGTLTLGGTNSYAGHTNVDAGVLRLGSAMGVPTLSRVNVAAGATFDVAGLNARVGSIAGAGAITIGAGTLGAGDDNSSTTFAGVLSGTGNFQKRGTGTLTLTGGNTVTGALTIDKGTLVLSGAGGRAVSMRSVTLPPGATLILDNTTGSNFDRIGDATSFQFSGGELRFLSSTVASNETLGTLTLSGGASRVTVAHNAGAGISSSVTFSALGTIASGATVNFSALGGILGFTPDGPHVFILGQPNGIMGSWARVGSDFAQYTPYGVTAFDGYYTGADGINVNDPAAIVRLTSASPASAWTLTRPGTTTDAGLNLTDLPLVDLGVSSTATLNLADGGLIKSATPATTIAGAGRLTAGGIASGQLNVAVQAGQTLTISAPIINNAGPNGIYGDADDGTVALVANDSGTLILAGGNSYSGGNFLNSGVVQVSADANLGAAVNDVTFGGGTLSIVAGFQTNPGRRFVIQSALTGTVDIATGQTLTIAGASDLVATGDDSSVWYKSGAGDLILGGANPNFGGTLQLDEGAVELRVAAALGDGQIALNGGTLRLRADTSTVFANAATVLASSAIDAARSTGSSPAVTLALGDVAVRGETLSLSAGSGATLALGGVTLLGDANFDVLTGTVGFGAVSGAFGLTKSGAGILELRGEGTYLGGTNIQGGVLRLGTGNAIPSSSPVDLASGALLDVNGFNASVGSLAGAGTLSIGTGAVTVGNNDASTIFSGPIFGSGGLNKTGSGTFTLSGTSSFSGSLTVTEGTLRFGIANAISDANAVNLGLGTTLDLNGHDQTFGSINGAGSIMLGGGTLNFGGTGGSSSVSGPISGVGGVVKSGSGTATISGANTYSGTTTVSAGVLSVQSSNALGSSVGATSVSAGGELRMAAGLAISGEPLSLAGSGASGAGALRLLSGASSWSGAFNLSGDATIGVDAGMLSLAGTMVLGGRMLTFTGAGQIDAAFTISGTSGLLKSGTGTLILGAANSFGGTLTIATGTVVVRNGSALGISGSIHPTVILPGGTLQFDDPAGIDLTHEVVQFSGIGAGIGAIRAFMGDNAMDGAMSLAGDAGIGVDSGASLTLSGVLSEIASGRNLTKLGAGTLIFAGTSTITGTLAVQAGTFQLGSDNRFGYPVGLDVSNGAVFDLNDNSESIGALTGLGEVQLGSDATAVLSIGVGGASGTFAGAITGFGDVIKNGSGTLNLIGANSFSGDVTILGGALGIDVESRLGTGALTIDGGVLKALTDVTLTRDLEIGANGGGLDSNGYTLVVTGSISGSTTLSKYGSGTVRLSGTSPFTGTLQAQAGLLDIAGSLTSARVNVQNGAFLGGNGTVGDVAVQSGGTVAPGQPIGRLNTGSFSMFPGARLAFELGGTTAGVNYDQIKVTGAVTLDGDFTLTLANGFQPAVGDTFYIILNDGTDAVNGFLRSLPEGTDFFAGGLTFRITYLGNGNAAALGNDVAVTVKALIPEPGTGTMFIISAFALATYCRFRRRIPAWPGRRGM